MVFYKMATSVKDQYDKVQEAICNDNSNDYVDDQEPIQDESNSLINIQNNQSVSGEIVGNNEPRGIRFNNNIMNSPQSNTLIPYSQNQTLNSSLQLNSRELQKGENL